MADKTALFVSKNGRAFETRILNSDKGKTAKFAFLHATSPFHAYYEDRVRHYEAGGEADDEEERKAAEEKKEQEDKIAAERAAAAEKEKEQEEAVRRKREAAARRASAADPIARTLLAQRSRIAAARTKEAEEKKKGEEEADDKAKDDEDSGSGKGSAAKKAADAGASSSGLIPPPALRFVSLAAPNNLTPVEVEVIKLTAQSAALAGKKSQFLKALTVREWTNPLFAFLQPRNAAFAYFTALVELYESILQEGTERLEKKKDGVESVVDEGNFDYETVLSIAEGGRDVALTMAAYRAEYERDAEERRQGELDAAKGGGLGAAGAIGIDWHDFVVVETITFPTDEIVDAVPPPPRRLKNEKVGESDAKMTTSAVPAAGEAMQESKDEDMMIESEDEDNEEIRVVPSYQPKVVSTSTMQDRGETRVVDPISGKSVPVGDLSEHMRIQLLDPKWAEERKKFLDKQKESNIVGGDDIARNIAGFAKERGDLFGSSEQELLDREAASKDQLLKANRLIREQAQIQQAPLPTPLQPPAKKARFDEKLSGSVPPAPSAPSGAAAAAASVPVPVFPPPPPPPPPPAYSAASMSVPSSASSATAAASFPVHAPPPPPQAQAPSTNEQPKPSQQPSANTILSAEEFLASLPDPKSVAVSVQIPHDPSCSKWNFDGRVLDVIVDVTTATVKTIKEGCQSDLGGMPINKMQLRMTGTGFLKDKDTLAKLNVGPGATLDLVPKVRGGRK